MGSKCSNAQSAAVSQRKSGKRYGSIYNTVCTGYSLGAVKVPLTHLVRPTSTAASDAEGGTPAVVVSSWLMSSVRTRESVQEAGCTGGGTAGKYQPPFIMSAIGRIQGRSQYKDPEAPQEATCEGPCTKSGTMSSPM
jgi:hypothetical protein